MEKDSLREALKAAEINYRNAGTDILYDPLNNSIINLSQDDVAARVQKAKQHIEMLRDLMGEGID